MRVNIRISVERDVENDLCIYSYHERKSYDVLSGRYSGLSRLFPKSGEYIVKIDFESDQFDSGIISGIFSRSDDCSYDNTRLVGRDTFIAYNPETLRGTYVLESQLSGYRCTIENDNPLYRIIPHIRKGSCREIKITVRQESKWCNGSSECPSGKQIFYTYREAKIAARDYRLRDKMKAVYRCEQCGHWHLTTKDGKTLIRKEIYDRRKEKRVLKKTESVLSSVWKDQGNPNRYWRVKQIGLKRKDQE